ERGKLFCPKPNIHAKKIMILVFWSIHGVIHHEYLPRGQCIDSKYYCEVSNIFTWCCELISTSKKRSRCVVCPIGVYRKTDLVCSCCGKFVCGEHSVLKKICLEC